jgi:hypothetical protein
LKLDGTTHAHIFHASRPALPGFGATLNGFVCGGGGGAGGGGGKPGGGGAEACMTKDISSKAASWGAGVSGSLHGCLHICKALLPDIQKPLHSLRIVLGRKQVSRSRIDKHSCTCTLPNTLNTHQGLLCKVVGVDLVCAVVGGAGCCFQTSGSPCTTRTSTMADLRMHC